MTDERDVTPSAAELEVRRYEARLGVWKVVLGTFIVGLAGVLIPGAISFYSTHSEISRKETELKLSQQAAHLAYIKEFFTIAINQDIELRIRFAHYFANLSGPDQVHFWSSYLDQIKKLRDNSRKLINDHERRLVEFNKLPKDQIDNAEFDQLNREIAWAIKEIGYAPTERSIVVALADNSPTGKKIRLYNETTEIVQRLAAGGPLASADLARFWDLYRRELLGVESSNFAGTMVAIGRVLQSLKNLNSPPNPELKHLADELVAIARQELTTAPQAAAQQQQQLSPRLQ